MPVGTGVYYSREQQVGLVYETFTFVNGQQNLPGVSVLLHDGRDAGGFSAEEAAQELVPLGPTGLDYQFTNLGQLYHDYAAGLFDEAWDVVRAHYRAQAPPRQPA